MMILRPREGKWLTQHPMTGTFRRQNSNPGFSLSAPIPASSPGHSITSRWGLNACVDAKAQSESPCTYKWVSHIMVQLGNLISMRQMLKMAKHPRANCAIKRINHTPWTGMLQVLRWTFSLDFGTRKGLIPSLKGLAHKCFPYPWRKEWSLGRISLNLYNTQDQGLASYSHEPNLAPLPDFVSEVLLEHRPCSFIYRLFMAAFVLQQLNWVDHMAHKTSNIYYLALYGKSLPTPAQIVDAIYDFSSLKVGKRKKRFAQ